LFFIFYQRVKSSKFFSTFVPQIFTQETTFGKIIQPFEFMEQSSHKQVIILAHDKSSEFIHKNWEGRVFPGLKSSCQS